MMWVNWSTSCSKVALISSCPPSPALEEESASEVPSATTLGCSGGWGRWECVGDGVRWRCVGDGVRWRCGVCDDEVVLVGEHAVRLTIR